MQSFMASSQGKCSDQSPLPSVTVAGRHRT